MDFKNALAEISKKYTVVLKAKDVAEIVVNEMLTPFNYIFVALALHENKLYLCDFENTLKTIPLDNKIIDNIIKESNVMKDEQFLFMPYEKVEDITCFVSCISKIAKLSN